MIFHYLEKYMKLRERKQLIPDPDIQLCPYPDCESYAKKINDNKYVSSVRNGHKFCLIVFKIGMKMRNVK